MEKYLQQEEDLENHDNILQFLKKNSARNSAQVEKKHIDLKGFSLYQTPKFNLLVKASSLFDNSILFENEFLEIQCITERKVLLKGIEVSFVLKYKPKSKDFFLTTLFEDGTGIEVQRKIEEERIRDETTQVVTMKGEWNKLFEFPKMELKIKFDSSNFFFYLIPIPFSINKFFETMPLTQHSIQKLHLGNNIVASKTFSWNLEIIDQFEQMTEIFTNIHEASEDLMILLAQFSDGSQYLIKFHHTAEQSMSVEIHSNDGEDNGEDIMNWLEWILSDSQ